MARDGLTIELVVRLPRWRSWIAQSLLWIAQLCVSAAMRIASGVTVVHR